MNMETSYELSPELKKRIRLYCALFGKSDNWDDRVINMDEVKYLCEPHHPSFLVSRLGNTLTKSSNLFHDRIRSRRPNEGVRGMVILIDKLVDFGNQGFHAPESTAADSPL